MSKKTTKPLTLNFSDIVLGANAETIREALEARIEIDRLLDERAKAYQQIAELEDRVDELLGDEAEFPFPEPPAPVFGYGPKTAKKKPAKKKPAPAAAQAQPESSPPAESTDSEPSSH